MSAISFFRESLKNLQTVGTVTRSSPWLCREAVDHTDYSKAKLIVEIGAGDGVITRHLLERMAPDARLVAFEVLPNMAKKLRKIRDKRLIVVEDSAEHLGKYLAKHRLGEVDYIVSAVPFVALPKELSYKIVRACKKHLRDGGTYSQVHYALSMKKMYKEIFGNVEVHRVYLNLPPAYVLTCEN